MSSPLSPLTPEQLRAALVALPGWKLEQREVASSLIRSFTFPDFQAALAFMADSVEDIVRLDHHPEWTNLYDRVTIRLSTHDAADRVTVKDVELAKLLGWKATVCGALER